MGNHFTVWILYALALNFALMRRARHSRKVSRDSRSLGERLRILIAGATGGTGLRLVQQALAHGHQVSTFVPNPQKLKIEHPNLRVVRGDVLDLASVESTMRKQDAILSALGCKRFFYPKILSEGTRTILRAMKSCQVPRFICESSLGVGRLGLPSTFLFVRLVLRLYFRDGVRQEKLIEESAVDWVIVRPASLTNRAARQLSLWQRRQLHLAQPHFRR